MHKIINCLDDEHPVLDGINPHYHLFTMQFYMLVTLKDTTHTVAIANNIVDQ